MSCLADAGDGSDGSQHRLLFDLTNNATLEFLESLYTFKIFYGRFHRYISFALCLAGILANIVHICVLTRPEMRRSSVHTLSLALPLLTSAL
uniref:Uncharacterized protein n=1 Tax=Ditylenchus dipsaci TaxID=166011 RepID=A0A915CVT0_9BILA